MWVLVRGGGWWLGDRGAPTAPLRDPARCLCPAAPAAHGAARAGVEGFGTEGWLGTGLGWQVWILGQHPGAGAAPPSVI